MMDKKKCECGCKNYAQVMHKDLYTNIKTFLCKNCEISYVLTALSKEQFFALLKNGHKTNEFMLHSDFYDDKTGEALQPKDY